MSKIICYNRDKQDALLYVTEKASWICNYWLCNTAMVQLRS